MKELYTIGETAALMGITTRTLRYYNSMGLISPSYTDPDTGYRYYSFKQFHYIDRIKYPVSYTHLDVYKRQIIPCAWWRLCSI